MIWSNWKFQPKTKFFNSIKQRVSYIELKIIWLNWKVQPNIFDLIKKFNQKLNQTINLLTSNVFNFLLLVNQFIFDLLSLKSDKLLSIINFNLTIDLKLKHVCFNDVIIYEQQKIVDTIIALIDKY